MRKVFSYLLFIFLFTLLIDCTTAYQPLRSPWKLLQQVNAKSKQEESNKKPKKFVNDVVYQYMMYNYTQTLDHFK